MSSRESATECYGGNDIRRVCSQVNHAAHVAVIDSLTSGDYFQRIGLARFRQSQPPVPAGQRQLKRRRRGIPRAGIQAATVRQGHGLAETTAFDPDGNGDGQASVARGNHLGLSGPVDEDLAHVTASSIVSALSSGCRSSARTSMPFGRNRASRSLGDTITFSIRSRTMRCCSAGKSWSQIASSQSTYRSQLRGRCGSARQSVAAS